MLYAEVVVRQKTNVEELTYSIPAAILPYIRRGSLVTVPLRRKTVQAVVVSLRRSVAPTVKARIRPITDIDRIAAFSEDQLTVIERLAQQHGASLAEVAYSALKEPAYPQPDRDTNQVRRTKPIFLQASWRERRRRYLNIIQRYGQNHSILLLFAQVNFAESFARLASPLGQKVIFHNGKISSYKKAVKAYRQGEPVILISTLQDAFFPLRPGDLILVDQPGHIASKQYQRPYLTLSSIARTRAAVEGLRLIEGGNLAPINLIPAIQAKEWKPAAYSRSSLYLEIFTRKGKELFVPGLEALVGDLVRQGKRLAIIVASRGWSPALMCHDCEHLFNCQNCGRTASVAKGELVCRYCHETQRMPVSCPSCGSDQLRAVGEGVSQITQRLRQRYAIQATELSSDQPTIDPSSQVLVATEKITTFPDLRFDVILFLSVDRLLTGAELDQSWELAELILHFRDRASQILVETYFPDHPVWGVGSPDGLRLFYAQELSERKRYLLPPFTNTFAIVGQGSSITKLRQDVAEKISQIIKLFSQIEVGEPTHSRLAGNEYLLRVQLLTPVKLTNETKAKMRQYLQPAWHLDIY